MARLHNAAHEVFALNLARGRSQVDAYRLAGFADEATNAHRLAAEPHIAQRRTELIDIIAARAEASAERVLAELARVGFADITQAVEIVRGKVKIRDTAVMPDSIKAAISEIRQGRDGVTVKYHDKGRALELLGKHLGLFKENINIDVNVSLADLVNGSYKLERGELIEGQAVDLTSTQQARNTPEKIETDQEPSD